MTSARHDPLLRADRLSVHYGGVVALSGVSLAAERGALHCIIGPNGAGKSTLFNVLCGVQRPDSGSVSFAGRKMTGLPLHAHARAGIARKFQVPSVFERLSVRDNLEVAFLAREGARSEATRRDEVSDLVGLDDLLDRRAGELAHGQKQWLEIGMALMCNPLLLLLDEPTAGMSAEETQRTAEILRRLQGGIGIIVIEHDMRFVRALDCHVLVMHQGTILVEGTFAEIEHDATVRDIYLGRQ